MKIFCKTLLRSRKVFACICRVGLELYLKIESDLKNFKAHILSNQCNNGEILPFTFDFETVTNGAMSFFTRYFQVKPFFTYYYQSTLQKIKESICVSKNLSPITVNLLVSMEVEFRKISIKNKER
jgi:hypothetical protein